MKQKVVIKVQMNCKYARCKAMKIALIPGVESITLEGKEQDQIAVIGEGIDHVALVKSLRKKMKFAEIVSVTPMQAQGEEKYGSARTVVWSPAMFYQEYMPCYVHVVQERHPDPCSIM